MLKVNQTVTDSPGVPDDNLALTYELRSRSRLRSQTEGGQEIGIILERSSPLRAGTLLKSTDGQLIQVIAAAEPVVTIAISNRRLFARTCYHLGNRHVPLQIGQDWVRFQPDHVLEAMICGLEPTLNIQKETAPFEPESGAYHKASGHTHSHAHTHDESVTHD